MAHSAYTKNDKNSIFDDFKIFISKTKSPTKKLIITFFENGLKNTMKKIR